MPNAGGDSRKVIGAEIWRQQETGATIAAGLVLGVF
jgi:hypothetical protein